MLVTPVNVVSDRSLAATRICGVPAATAGQPTRSSARASLVAALASARKEDASCASSSETRTRSRLVASSSLRAPASSSRTVTPGTNPGRTGAPAPGGTQRGRRVARRDRCSCGPSEGSLSAAPRSPQRCTKGHPSALRLNECKLDCASVVLIQGRRHARTNARPRRVRTPWVRLDLSDQARASDHARVKRYRCTFG